jgi:hypothetical protein
MERKRTVRKRSIGHKKRKLTGVNARKIIPFSLLFLLLLFSVAAIGYVIFFRAAPIHAAGLIAGWV